MALLIACKNKTQDDSTNLIIKVKSIPDNGIVINKWMIFEPSIEEDHDFIISKSPIDIPIEKSLNNNKLLNYLKCDSILNSRFDSCFINKIILTGKTPLEFKTLQDTTTKTLKENYYLACILQTNKPISTRLHFSSDARSKIWLNNNLICDADYTLPVASYREFIAIDLEKGDNLLLIKVTSPNVNNELYARLENKTKRAMERYLGLHNHFILYGGIFKNQDSITLDILFPGIDGQINIYDNNNNLILQDSIYKNKKWIHCIKEYKNGTYTVKAIFDDINLSQNIFIGDIIDSTKNIIEKLQFKTTSEISKHNIDALIFRFNHLLQNTYLSDVKFVQLFIQLRDIYLNLEMGNDPFKHTSGIFIRSYISKIDSSVQYYILHVPSTYKKGNSMPVGITVPVNVYDKFPYLQSFRVANSKFIDFLQDLSEKYNLIIVEPGSRRKNSANYNDIEESELFHILNDIEKDYNIDRKRLYMAGTCSGAHELVKMIAKYPDKFAATGMVAPDIVYVDDNVNPWVKANNPIMFLGNNKYLPIFSTHSIIDRHVPIESSENFNLVADYFSFENFSYVQIENEFPKYYPDEYYDDIFKFTINYSLNVKPKQIDFSTNQMIYNKSFWVTIDDMKIPGEAHLNAKINRNKLIINKENIEAYTLDLQTLPYDKSKRLKIIDNGKTVFNNKTEDTSLYLGHPIKSNVLRKNNLIAGPLAHVFSQKFIIVKGTSGNSLETGKICALADTINKYWFNRYFCNCSIKFDNEITENDIKTSSLILLGNFNSNAFLNKIKTNIPLSITNESVTIIDKMISGNKLCFYMVYPNPLNKNKYVGIIGYNNPDYIALGSETSEGFNDISNYGWFDYKVWEGSEKFDIDHGYFNSAWK